MIVTIWAIKMDWEDEPGYYCGSSEEALSKLRSIAEAEWPEYHCETWENGTEDKGRPYKFWKAPHDECHEVGEDENGVSIFVDDEEAKRLNKAWWTEVVASYAPNDVPDMPPYPGFREAVEIMWGNADELIAKSVRCFQVDVPIRVTLRNA